ncbi:MAG TPA: hypothetical protein ENI57_02315 [Ignavibacteria bacterium]|nr:hypothetical protein [Ignavibacteria bacterium]
MRLSLKLLKSKILISILLISFISAPLGEAICQISLNEFEIPLSVELNRIEKHYDNNTLNNFNVRNGIDDCEEPGISIFIVNIHNDKNSFYKQALISPNLIPLIEEHLSEKKLISKLVERISFSPIKISNKLYKLNSLFLI